MKTLIIETQKCIVANTECNHVSTCKYLLDRFGVYECEPIEVKKVAVEDGHQHELQERAKIKTWSERKLDLIKEE